MIIRTTVTIEIRGHDFAEDLLAEATAVHVVRNGKPSVTAGDLTDGNVEAASTASKMILIAQPKFG
jgi:hypothetical protein